MPSTSDASPQTACRHFTGYKPCRFGGECSSSCVHVDRVETRVLLIHLGALGAVVRSTALLPAIRRRYPRSHITWITDRPADQLLKGHPLIDRILVSDHEGLLELAALSFDVALVVDKSLKATGILKATQAEAAFGFSADGSGAILPLTEEAQELWSLGLSDHKKFHVNRKPETRLIHEALSLGPWTRDPYHLYLTSEERALAAERKVNWARGRSLVGINTGCAATLPAKKLSVSGHVELISRLVADSRLSVVLLGGREDTVRNREIADGVLGRTGKTVLQSPTELGLRDGLASVAACDAVISGDSLGMHMALALGIPLVVWFGPSCLHEIDLYGRGVAVMTKATCSPCWKRNCERAERGETMCYDQIDWNEMTTALYSLLRDNSSSDRIFG